MRDRDTIYFVPANKGMAQGLYSLDLESENLNRVIEFPGTVDGEGDAYIGIKKIQNIKDIKTTTKEKAEKQGLYNVIGKETDDSYIEELKKLTKNTEKENNLKIVYTPLHGTGNNLVNRILKEQGVTNIYTVKEQEEPDPEFSTVKNPNPEDKKAFELALKLAEEKDADIVLATDPDADRLGVYAKDKKTNKYIPITGNMTGLLLSEYILERKKENNEKPEKNTKDIIITTIVSTKMIRRIAEEYKICLTETLTGFKYIGEQIRFLKTIQNENKKIEGTGYQSTNKKVDKKSDIAKQFEQALMRR